MANVSVVDSLRELVRDMMKSLDYIVGLVIGSACALALVVLFNLCNISITERHGRLRRSRYWAFIGGRLAFTSFGRF